MFSFHWTVLYSYKTQRNYEKNHAIQIKMPDKKVIEKGVLFMIAALVSSHDFDLSLTVVTTNNKSWYD